MDDSYRRMWESYERYTKTMFTVRKGYAVLDNFDENLFSYEGVPEKLFMIRGETTIEHQAKTAMLMRMCIEENHMVDLFGRGCNVNISDELKYELVTYALIHDVGDISTGNIAKDGTENDNPPKLANDQKVQFERFVNDAFDYNGTKDRFKGWYRNINDKKAFNYLESTITKVLFSIGQLENVLMLAFLEKHNIKGDITRKPKLSGDIQEAIELTETNNALDIFAAYMKMQIDSRLTRWQKEVIYGILEEAIIDVRGEFFPWWDKIPVKENEE